MRHHFNITAMIPWQHGIIEIRQDTEENTLQAVCTAIVYDEDDTARLCRWTGPVRAPDEQRIALDDACWHHHEEEGSCGACFYCQQRLGMEPR